MRIKFLFLFAFLMVAGIAIQSQSRAEACGGLFCQNIPVDQQAERIIFAVNDNATITAYVQINYTGSAPDFSWVVPVPSVPEVDVAEIETFDELSRLTAPQFLPPPTPDCAVVEFETMMEDGAGVVMSAPAGGVEVLASGTAGPFAYDVVTSPDPNELITWLRTNNYRITEEMEPLVRVYTDEGMIFLAMKLQPDQGVQDIQPVVMTYESRHPMIPLRLTAVAANPNMSVVTWVFSNEQVVPANYAHPAISDSDIRFDFLTFNNNYLQLVDQAVDLYEGRAFVTEYAQPTAVFESQFQPQDPLLRQLTRQHTYMTRVFGRISPEEMTVDPVFDFDPSRPSVDNVHDLSNFDPETVWGCKDAPEPMRFDPSVVPPDWR